MPPHCPLLLLLLLLIVAAAAQAVAGADDNIAKVCGGGEACVEMLTSMPESSTPMCPRRAAELAFQYVLKEGTALSSEMDKALAAPKEPGNVRCLKDFDSDLKSYVAKVAKAAPEKDFNGARDLFNQMLYYPPGAIGCDINEPVIGKVLTYEYRLQVTSDLFNKAAPPPPPPAEE